MNRLFLFLILITTITSCKIGLKARSISFDKNKWLVSSAYRYEASKTCFPDLRGKSKDEVVELLGTPSEVNGEQFIYCFDVHAKSYYDNDLKRELCNCRASMVIVDFAIDERWRTTFIHAEF